MNAEQKAILVKAIKQFPFELQDPSRGETDEPTTSTIGGICIKKLMFYAGKILDEDITATGNLYTAIIDDEVSIWAWFIIDDFEHAILLSSQKVLIIKYSVEKSYWGDWVIEDE